MARTAPRVADAVDDDVAALTEQEQIPPHMRGIAEHMRLVAHTLERAAADDDYGAVARLSSELRHTRVLLDAKGVTPPDDSDIDKYLAIVSAALRDEPINAPNLRT